MILFYIVYEQNALVKCISYISFPKRDNLYHDLLVYLNRNDCMNNVYGQQLRKYSNLSAYLVLQGLNYIPVWFLHHYYYPISVNSSTANLSLLF